MPFLKGKTRPYVMHLLAKENTCLLISKENIDVSKIRQLQTHYSLDSSLEFVSRIERRVAVPAAVSCR